VNLEIFAGPMDLLLHLVRKEEVDIYDIPIAKITDQYIRYLELMKQLDIDVAGDFLVMAATLMQIKSAMLLPRTQGGELGAEDLSDPRAELIRQLLEYKKFKDASNLLSAAADEQGERFTRPDTVIEQLKGDSEPTFDLEQINIWDLLEAFDKMMEATGAKFDISHIIDDTPIDLYQIEILHRLQTEGPMGFERIFESKNHPDGKRDRLTLVGLFLAILELTRSQLISAEQAPGNAGIYLRATTDEPAETAVRKAILKVESEVAAAQETQTTEQKEELPIPIVEIPAAEPIEEETFEEIPGVEQILPIPIVELPPDGSTIHLPRELESAGSDDLEIEHQ
jgi:segregation and condensation protein A